MKRPKTWTELLEAAGGPAEVARYLSRGRAREVTMNNVCSWKARDNLPPRYWRALRGLLGTRGHVVEYSEMVRLAERE